MRIRRTPGLLALAAAGALSLSACSSSAGTATPGAGLLAPAGGASNAAAAPSVSAAADAGSRAPVDSRTTPKADVVPGAVPRQIITTGTLTVETKDVGPAVTSATSIVTQLGGRIDAQKIENRADGGHDAQLTVKVPPARYADAVARLSALGKQRSLEESTQDVTGQVVDLESRAATERKSIDRIRAFMDKATTIKDLVALEGELTQREAQLNSEVAQANALRGQAAMGTITVSFVEPGVVPPPAKLIVHHKGFGAGLSTGWHAFTHSIVVLLTVVGALAPFAAPVLLALAVWIVVRRRRRPAAMPAEPDAATT